MQAHISMRAAAHAAWQHAGSRAHAAACPRPSVLLHCSGSPLAACDAVIADIKELVRAGDSPHRRVRIAALRHELERMMASLPPAQHDALEARLRAERTQRSAQRNARVARAMAEGPHLVVDCSYAAQHCRPGLETRSLAKQVETAMAHNRRAERPLGLHVTSWQGEVAAFGRHIGAHNWPVVLHPEPLLDCFPPEQLVLLSPDATEPMMSYDIRSTYVIGGIVDRTIRKGVTHNFAAAHGIRSLRLPIAEHAAALGMDEAGINARPVLNVSDVARALIDVYGGTPWPQALHMAVAQRKRKQQVEKPKRQRVANLGKAAAEQ